MEALENNFEFYSLIELIYIFFLQVFHSNNIHLNYVCQCLRDHFGKKKKYKKNLAKFFLKKDRNLPFKDRTKSAPTLSIVVSKPNKLWKYGMMCNLSN